MGGPGSQETCLRPQAHKPSWKGVGSMLTSRRIHLALVVASLSLCLFSPSALAGAPATVTVRAEGSAGTVLAPTQVTTTTVPVVKEGHSCSGTSAAGALDIATSGNWGGSWFEPGGFFVETIASESLVNAPSSYWTFWLDNKPATTGICEAELQPGDSILFFPECFGECPAPPSPLGIEAPAVAEVGQSVTVKVNAYANPSGARSAASGATVAYEGGHSSTDVSGHATVKFAHVGEMTVGASSPQAVRTETTICVHAGADGNCGTTRSVTGSGSSAGSATPTPAGGVLSSAAYKGPYALVADVTGPIDGHVYSRRRAPRVLAGTIVAHSAVTSVSAELRRRYRDRCYAYDGARARFLAARCGSGSFFKLADGGAFSYLLPAALAPGRYVLDIKASDVAGNTTTLARGTSRRVFYVR
jgi:hypothetical protein